MNSSHSSIPNTESEWGFQIVIARSDLAEVTTALPDKSAE